MVKVKIILFSFQDREVQVQVRSTAIAFYVRRRPDQWTAGLQMRVLLGLDFSFRPAVELKQSVLGARDLDDDPAASTTES